MLIVATSGGGPPPPPLFSTLITRVPLIPLAVAVMVALPTATPVTVPVELPTEATEGLFDDQANVAETGWPLELDAMADNVTLDPTVTEVVFPVMDTDATV
jgi:hypothetical protein